MSKKPRKPSKAPEKAKVPHNRRIKPYDDETEAALALREHAREVRRLARQRAMAEGARTEEEIAMNWIATLRRALAEERRRIARAKRKRG